MIPLRDGNPTRRPAVVTLAIIVACVVVYFVVQPSPWASTRADAVFNYAHAVVPVEVRTGRPLTPCELQTRACGTTGGDVAFFPHKRVYLAVVESMFLHGSVLHLAGNVLFLWIFGNNVEDRLGRVRYLLFYLAAGLVAAAAYVVVHPSSASPLVGASGAIAGAMGAYLVWFPRAKVLTLVSIVPLRLPAWLVLGAWFVLQFFTGPSSSVAWVAHVGGFAFGAIVGAVLGRPQEPPARWAAPPA